MGVYVCIHVSILFYVLDTYSVLLYPASIVCFNDIQKTSDLVLGYEVDQFSFEKLVFTNSRCIHQDKPTLQKTKTAQELIWESRYKVQTFEAKSFFSLYISQLIAYCHVQVKHINMCTYLFRHFSCVKPCFSFAEKKLFLQLAISMQVNG